MQDPDEMLVQIERLKRAKKRWKITAICALGVLGVLVCLGLSFFEKRRAEQATFRAVIQKEMEEADKFMEQIGEFQQETAEWEKRMKKVRQENGKPPVR